MAANTELDRRDGRTGDLIKSGAGALRLDHAGNAYGNTRVLAGTLIGDTLSGDIGNAATVVFNQAADGGYAGAIGGLGGVNGRMVKQGGGADADRRVHARLVAGRRAVQRGRAV